MLPHPLRYRLVWHSTSNKPPLYIWRAVPPSGQFIALGMIASTSEEPPSTSAMVCVPRRWCARQQNKSPRPIWRDDGQGGRPGSFWSVPTIELVVAARSGEPPEEALDGWCLRKDRVSTETWLLQQ